MPSARQLSITADQIGSRIAEAKRRISDGLDRTRTVKSDLELQDALTDIHHAYRDQQAWEKVEAAYAKLVA